MALATFLTVFWLASQQQACGQFVSQQVGGVSIDAQGIVKNVSVDDLDGLKRVREAAFQPVPGDLKTSAAQGFAAAVGSGHCRAPQAKARR